MGAVIPPPLEVLNRREPHAFEEPKKCINNKDDMERFKYTQGFNDIGQFIMQLNRALCPRTTPTKPEGAAHTSNSSSSSDAQPPKSTSDTPSSSSSSMLPPNALSLPPRLKKTDPGSLTTFTLHSKREDPPSVKQLQALLEKLKSFIDEAPPSTEPRRFGNTSFRIWHRLLDERVDDLLQEFLPREVLDFPQTGDTSPLAELRAYFLGSFGSSTRLDYGTGHELSFLAFLGCLWKLGGFGDGGAGRTGDIERSLVFGVFEPYLNLMRKLILTYTLEPAGSHGVWGLDDHFFLPYIFGSAQLTQPVTDDSTQPMPQEGSVRGAPKPDTVCKADRVEAYRGENMYFSAVGFINDVKKGPFWEHSPVLYNVSGVKDGWGKINKGMIKMFLAEVLGKFPVVQHFPFGSLFSWELDPGAPEAALNTSSSAAPAGGASMGAAAPMVGTQAPWATAAPGGAGGLTRGVVSQMPGSMPRPGAMQMPGSMPRPLPRQAPPGVNPLPDLTRRGGNA